MDEIVTLTKEQVYADIAAEQTILFKLDPSPRIILVKINDHDPACLLNRRKPFGSWGTIADRMESPYQREVEIGYYGRYCWLMAGEMAYQFCVGILPYLVDTPKWRYCKECIDAYENR